MVGTQATEWVVLEKIERALAGSCLSDLGIQFIPLTLVVVVW